MSLGLLIQRKFRTKIMRIEVDTTSLGTLEQPAFVVYPRYGNRPAQTVILKATTMETARAEVKTRFGVDPS